MFAKLSLQKHHRFYKSNYDFSIYGFKLIPFFKYKVLPSLFNEIVSLNKIANK